MKSLRLPLAQVLTVLALVAAMLSQGYARGLPSPQMAFEMVICAEEGARVILVDATGAPIEESCPDLHCQACLGAVGPALASYAQTNVPQTPTLELTIWSSANFAVARWSAPFQPRGPPTET